MGLVQRLGHRDPRKHSTRWCLNHHWPSFVFIVRRVHGTPTWREPRSWAYFADAKSSRRGASTLMPWTIMGVTEELLGHGASRFTFLPYLAELLPESCPLAFDVCTQVSPGYKKLFLFGGGKVGGGTEGNHCLITTSHGDDEGLCRRDGPLDSNLPVRWPRGSSSTDNPRVSCKRLEAGWKVYFYRLVEVHHPTGSRKLITETKYQFSGVDNSIFVMTSEVLAFRRGFHVPLFTTCGDRGLSLVSAPDGTQIASTDVCTLHHLPPPASYS